MCLNTFSGFVRCAPIRLDFLFSNFFSQFSFSVGQTWSDLSKKAKELFNGISVDIRLHNARGERYFGVKALHLVIAFRFKKLF